MSHKKGTSAGASDSSHSMTFESIVHDLAVIVDRLVDGQAISSAPVLTADEITAVKSQLANIRAYLGETLPADPDAERTTAQE